MSAEWSIYVKCRGDKPLPEGEAYHNAFEYFAEQLDSYHGSASGGPGFETYTAQLSIEQDDPMGATFDAIEITRKNASLAGLPERPVVQIDVVRADELDRQLETPNFPELVGITEIAELLDVSRQRAHQVATRDDFPVPVAEPAAGPVWTRPSLNRFIDRWPRKQGRPAH